VELSGLEPRRSDLARGIVIARSSKPLTKDEQRSLWKALAGAGVTEPEDPDRDAPDDEDDIIERQWLAAPWLPPTASEIDGQKSAFEAAAAQFQLEAIWCVKVETGIDGLGWAELAASDPDQGEANEEDDEEDAEEEESDEDEEAEGSEDPDELQAVEPSDDSGKVLYTAPDAPSAALRLAEAAAAQAASETEPAEDEPTEDFDDELGEDITSTIESHWRNGPPPLERSVTFPIERYPEMVEEFDWESFGIAIKLSGPDLPGEESIVNAFFALWLSVFQDERTDDFEPFSRADVVHDRKHRSALMWIERLQIPATASDQVNFLLWIAARINDIVPLAWARFDPVDDAVKSRAITEDGTDPFVLAGNPFAERFRRHGEDAALQWAVAQSAWSRRELAGMLIEVALEHDPDLEPTAAVAERLLRRALAFDANSDANGYLAIVFIRQHRLPEAVALARTAARSDVNLLVVGEAAEHLPDELGSALILLDDATLRATEPDEIADLVASIARYAPRQLDATLTRLPRDVALVPYLYNASFSLERPQALAVLRRVLSLPVPDREAGEGRTALVMAWNNACIHAHALGDYKLAVELAEGGQPYAPENPYIYHSGACAYAAVGDIDKAIEQVKLAIEHDYEHAEKMETDIDLASLHSDPRFSQLFKDWRTRRADLN
jgi:tetratricopeptide (TPR) repeat protein